MLNIFDELDNILKTVNESTEEKEEKAIKSIPVNPEMETAEQGRQKAFEKISKYFYNLSSKGFGKSELTKNDDIDLPDDFIDTKIKGKLDGVKDKDFEKNKVLWDQDDYDKVKKEVNIDGSDSDDEFDDFDYRDNEFGDDMDDSELETENMDGSGSGSSDDKSEDDKLRDEINDAIDQMKDNKESSSAGEDGNESENESGNDSGSKSDNSSSGNKDSGNENDGNKEGSSGFPTGNRGDSPSASSAEERLSAKDRKLKELQDALESGDEKSFDETVDKMKEGEDGSGSLAGEKIDNPDNDALKNDMKSAGFSDKEIEEMDKIKNRDTSKDFNEEELDNIKKKVVDGLEKKCESRGGSALAKTVVKNALKLKIGNDEWKSMLELFLKNKSIMKGNTAKKKNKTIWGNKNHLWRGAVLPTKTEGHGEIQKIYCFVDFSGSVNQDLVYTFLGKVIDLCQELSYTDVVVYGFGQQIVLPRKINGKMLKSQGKDVVLSQTWDYISSQNPGPGFENFEDVAHTINEIRRKDKDSVFLIFGDALWSSYGNQKPPVFLKYICGEKTLDYICCLTYYIQMNSVYAGEISYLKELVGLKHIICTKASSIRE